MILLATVDYVLIVVFFLIAGALLTMIVGGSYQESEVVAHEQQPAPPERKIAFAALGAIFLFFLFIAWAANRHSSD